MNKLIKLVYLLPAFFVLTIFYYNNQDISLTIGVFAGNYWDVPDPNAYALLDFAIEEYEKLHPNVHVEYISGIQREDYSSWLADCILENKEPDIYMVLPEDFDTLSSIGALHNLDDLIVTDTSFHENIYYESCYEQGNFNEHQYALPFACNPTLMFFNETLLTQEGIELPNENWTVNDLYSICEKITRDTNDDGVIDQYGIYNYSWKNLIDAYGYQLFDEYGTKAYLNTKEMKIIVQDIKRFTSLNHHYNLSSKDFDLGNVAFYPLSFATYKTYQSYPYQLQKYNTFNWNCISMPTVDGYISNNEIDTVLLSMSAKTNHTKESWELLRFLSGNVDVQKNVLKNSQGLSVLKEVSNSQETIQMLKDDSNNDVIDLSILNKTLELRNNQPKFKKQQNVMEKIDNRIDQMILKDDDIDIGLINLQKEIETNLNE